MPAVEIERFEEICRTLPYRPKGMFYSEVFLFLQACDRHGIQTIVESGVKLGMSTALIRAAFDGTLISIDKAGCDLHIEGVEFIKGDSRLAIPHVLRRHSSEKIALLIDGPKGAPAVALMWEAMLWANVRVCGIHDMRMAYYAGAAAESQHSHDPLYRRLFGRRLDDMIQHDYRRKYPEGPGLSIWEKQK